MPRIEPSLFGPEWERPRHTAEDAVVRKWIEEEQLVHFLNAYLSVTGDSLQLVPYESPDFIGYREDGRPVGVELTAVCWDPESRIAAKILRGEPMDADEVIDRIGLQLHKKSNKRKAPGWTHPNATILVLMLEDAGLDDVHWIFDPALCDEWASYGFEEIWAADYTQLDAYRDIELFGLHPSCWWGYHRRAFQKPYG